MIRFVSRISKVCCGYMIVSLLAQNILSNIVEQQYIIHPYNIKHVAFAALCDACNIQWFFCAELFLIAYFLDNLHLQMSVLPI